METSKSTQVEPAGTYRTDRLTRQLYSTDASIYQVQPDGVSFPHRPEDLRNLVDFARSRGESITIRGGGTSLSGQAIGEGIVVDCSRHLTDVLDLDPENRTVRVQPGVVLEQLNKLLASRDLMFGPDVAPDSRATLGGMIGNNSAGAHSIRYGHTSEHIKRLTCVLSNGERVRFHPVPRSEADARASGNSLEARLYRTVPSLVEDHAEVIRERFPDLPRNVAGYGLDRFLDRLEKGYVDFAQLVAGSEGTLALTESATLGVVPEPEVSVLGVLHCDSLREALKANRILVEEQPHALELIDRKIIELARDSLEYARKLRWVEGDPRALLVVEETGNSREEALDRIRSHRENLSEAGVSGTFLEAVDPDLQADVWAVRKAGLPLLLGLPGNRKPTTFVEDTVVGTDRLDDYVDRFQDLVAEHGTEAAFYGHASVGCLHIRPLVDLKDEQDIGNMRDLARDAVDLVAEFGGSVSGEHGDGLARSEWLRRYYGEEIVGLFRRIKQAFDPEGIFNPGKIVDPPRMDENLRFGSTYRVDVPDTVQDLSDQGGFQELVELCNGNGACRKEESGTMCPSYMATREEVHSTRGRANALRGLISGDLPPDSLTDGTMEEVMELCISCKACKSECPSNVDMAPLKEEIKHKINRENGVSLRDRLFGLIGPTARRLAGYQPLVSWLQTLPGIDLLAKRILGIAPARDLPAFSSRPFRPGTEERPGRTGSDEKPNGRVVLYVDTFSGYIESDLGRSAHRLLANLGYEVVVPETPCCGRPMMSKGMLERAQEQVEANLEVLYPYADQNLPIVGLEPSCVSALTDDFPRYAPGHRADSVAERAELLSSFLARNEAFSPSDPSDRNVLIHGHCHQKALWGTDPLRELMDELTTGDVSVIDSGCCGMAGSFGFEKEHYDHSEAMAQRRLVPEVVSAGPDTVVVAEGTSCRQQIAHFTGREALHPVEALDIFTKGGSTRVRGRGAVSTE